MRGYRIFEKGGGGGGGGGGRGRGAGVSLVRDNSGTRSGRWERGCGRGGCPLTARYERRGRPRGLADRGWLGFGIDNGFLDDSLHKI